MYQEFSILKVLSETKKALSGQLPSPGKPLVVEISLKTAEGDSMVLEWWRLAVVAGGDPQVKSLFNSPFLTCPVQQGATAMQSIIFFVI